MLSYTQFQRSSFTENNFANQAVKGETSPKLLPFKVKILVKQQKMKRQKRSLLQVEDNSYLTLFKSSVYNIPFWAS